MFGADYPWITPEKWLTAFEQVEIEGTVRPKILKENTMRILGLQAQG